MNDPSNQQDGNSNAQDGGRDFDDRQPDQLDQAARDSLINRAEAEAAQQDQDEESDAMIAHVEGTNEVKSEEDGATAKFTEIGSEQAGLTNQKERQTATDPGMPVKGLQGNTGLAAAGAHHVQTNAAMGGAHDHPAGTSTLEETIGIDKYLRTNTATTATTAAEANHEKASAAVGGPQDLFTLEETALLHPGTRETVQQQQQQILVPGAYPMAGTGISNLTNNDEDEAPVDSSG
ncbi:expressed unknown protein [Seminavis robusta]|uniref:Uncharacterized protein n=1 Tax=Seminavis robusta TaxID=568900 RepID=A0A9N8E243_9STRA|nr:expressed unknown protein [Seminavis robusta]|eukprot:Sro481_g151500.1 n/a (234) ;mRNA; f:10139-10926